MNSKSFGVITYDGNECKTFRNAMEAARYLHVSESTVRRAIYGGIPNVNGTMVYYNSSTAIEQIAKAIQENQAKILEQEELERLNGLIPLDIPKPFSLKKRKKKEETPEMFAAALTKKNEYLTEDWEKSLHFNMVVDAYKWGLGLSINNNDNL